MCNLNPQIQLCTAIEQRDKAIAKIEWLVRTLRRDRLTRFQKKALLEAQLFVYLSQFETYPKITEEEQMAYLRDRRPRALLISRYEHNSIL